MEGGLIKVTSVVISALALLLNPVPIESSGGLSGSQINKGPSKPVQLASFDHASRISKLADGKLIAPFLTERGKEQEAAARYSDDNGYSWSEPELLFTLPASDGRFGGPEVLVDRDGEVHLFFVNAAHANAGRAVPDRRIDIWHTKSVNGRKKWQPPRRIWEGYTGSLNSVIQLRSGPFSFLSPMSPDGHGEREAKEPRHSLTWGSSIVLWFTRMMRA